MVGNKQNFYKPNSLMGLENKSIKGQLEGHQIKLLRNMS